MTVQPLARPRAEEILTALIVPLVLVCTGTGLFVPGFYTGIVDPDYLLGNITADAVSLVSAPLLAACVLWSRRGWPAARLVWLSLLAYLGYAYATFVFDRTYTVLFPAYLAIFGMCCFAVAALVSRLDVPELAGKAAGMKWRRVMAGYVIFTGVVLYAIELPMILSRIPGGTQAGGTPFMALDLALVAPLAVLIGIWLWQRRPWGIALAGVFLVKAVALVTGFLIADYIHWFAGTLENKAATVTFTIVVLLAYFFTWNYFKTFERM
jgi:hypothetical protein